MDEFNTVNHDHTISLDIESVPMGDRDESILKTADELWGLVPKSYSKAKQETWVVKEGEKLKAAMEKEYRDRSFNPIKGRIVCIGLKFDDNPIEMISYEEDEEKMLIRLADRLEKFSRYIYSSLFIGNMIYDFDMVFIIQKAFKFDNKRLIRYLPTNKNDKRIFDLSNRFNLGVYGKHTKLGVLCEFFDIETPKDDLTGAEVLDAFNRGEIPRIEKYCGRDVQAGYDCYLKMLP